VGFAAPALTACQRGPPTPKVRAGQSGPESRIRAVVLTPGSNYQEATDMANKGGVAADRLKSFVERIERLEEEKQALTADIREVYSEAKGAGFDVKILRQIIRLRKMDADDRSAMEAVLDVYKRALDM
jgi:uncharacterized protein (UPF0335 family)